MLALFLLAALSPPARAGDNEDLAKALQELQGSLQDVLTASSELAKAQEAQMAFTTEARAHALEWLMAYRNGPEWAPQMERAAVRPVSADVMVLVGYTDACLGEDTPLELRYGLCAKDWKTLTDMKNEGWELHATLGQVADAYGQADVALVAGRMALELNQKNADLAYKVSYYAIKARQPDIAGEAAAYAMALEMREDVIAETALVLAKTGALPTGVALLEQALTVRPTSGLLLTREGLLFAGGGRPELAVPVLERAEATAYTGADLQVAWGHTLMVQGKPEEALLRYRRAVAIDPATRAEVPPELQPRL